MEEGLWKIIEPIMRVEVTTPSQYQSDIVNGINKRKGVVVTVDHFDDLTSIESTIPLNEMFGFSAFLRFHAKGSAEYTLEYSHYDYCDEDTTAKLLKEHEDNQIEEKKLKSKK